MMGIIKTMGKGKRVRIVDDVREGSPAKGMEGVYLGDMPFSALVYLSDEDSRMYGIEPFLEWNEQREEKIPLYKDLLDALDPKPTWEELMSEELIKKPYYIVSDNPLIELDNGEKIWGAECWWRFVGDEK